MHEHKNLFLSYMRRILVIVLVRGRSLGSLLCSLSLILPSSSTLKSSRSSLLYRNLLPHLLSLSLLPLIIPIIIILHSSLTLLRLRSRLLLFYRNLEDKFSECVNSENANLLLGQLRLYENLRLFFNLSTLLHFVERLGHNLRREVHFSLYGQLLKHTN